MFGNDQDLSIKNSSISFIGEAVKIEGAIKSVDKLTVAGLIKGPLTSSNVTITSTGSIVGTIKADNVEIYGHVDGRISAKQVIIKSTGIIKGDINFAENLQTENGASIEGHIKKTTNIISSKIKLPNKLIFEKKKITDKKKAS